MMRTQLCWVSDRPLPILLENFLMTHPLTIRRVERGEQEKFFSELDPDAVHYPILLDLDALKTSEIKRAPRPFTALIWSDEKDGKYFEAYNWLKPRFWFSLDTFPEEITSAFEAFFIEGEIQINHQQGLKKFFTQYYEL